MLSFNQIVLLIVPWLLMPTTYLGYQMLGRRLGPTRGYFAGFMFYWTVWCFLVPLVLLGSQGLLDLFKSAASPFGEPGWLGAFCLLAPPFVALVFIFPKAIGLADTRIVLVSAILAVVNGILEEVLWRGAFLTLFRDSFWLGMVYPTIGFALWHFSPQSIFPYTGSGGRVALVAQVGFLGLLWAWIANNTGTILWVAAAHILIDFSALGWPPRAQQSATV